MTAGIPGMSLGGVFYILLCGWMTAREGGRWLRGESTTAGRRAVRRHLPLAAGMLAALWGTLQLAAALTPRSDVPYAGGSGVFRHALGTGRLSLPLILLVAAALLATLHLLLGLLRRVHAQPHAARTRPGWTPPICVPDGAQSPDGVGADGA